MWRNDPIWLYHILEWVQPPLRHVLPFGKRIFWILWVYQEDIQICDYVSYIQDWNHRVIDIHTSRFAACLEYLWFIVHVWFAIFFFEVQVSSLYHLKNSEQSFIGVKISSRWSVPSQRTCHPVKGSDLQAQQGEFEGMFPETSKSDGIPTKNAPCPLPCFHWVIISKAFWIGMAQWGSHNWRVPGEIAWSEVVPLAVCKSQQAQGIF